MILILRTSQKQEKHAHFKPFQSRPLIENDPRNLRIGGEGFPGAVPEVVLLATEGPSMLKIGGGTEGVKGLLNFPGLERELKPSMW